jgi:hypothetical protein
MAAYAHGSEPGARRLEMTEARSPLDAIT